MSRALLSALLSRSVPTVLLAVGLAVAYVPREGTDHEAIEAAAHQPDPRHAEGRAFRLPGPADFPHQYMPWIESREQFIAHLTRGEDPTVVCRHVEGPEEELIEYLAEVFARAGQAATGLVGREAEVIPDTATTPRGRARPRAAGSAATPAPGPGRNPGDRTGPDGSSGPRWPWFVPPGCRPCVPTFP
jgi:hypothetical protein